MTIALPRTASHRAGTAFLGMVLFLGSWAMLFASLFFAYGVVRANAHAWPPADLPRLPLGLPGFATLVLAGSSFLYENAQARLRGGRSGVSAAIAGAIFLGAVFLGAQSVVWRELWAAGLRPDTGTYASVFFGFTVFHALHVLVGLGALAWLAFRGARGTYSAAHHLPVRLWGLYWHMVGIIWGLMFVTVYVV
jgi:heme/copper-type cytochrome/quinol oxidase subunit 3